MKKITAVIFIFLVFLFFITGCENNNEHNTVKDNKLVIAEQYGLAYAPVQLIKELELLQQADSDLKIEWKQLSNTAAIRESMLAGEVDIAFMAIPPFLIARDKGMNWKIISGLSQSPLGLMVNRDYIKSITDFKKTDKIALPQPGSIQHILLSMAAEKEFGNPKIFDNQLLTMKHPDAMNALLSRKEVAGHFASPPYLFQESREAGIKQILSGEEAFGGEFTFIIGVSTEKFYQNEKEKYQLFKNSLNQAVKEFYKSPEKTAKILADNYDLKIEETKEYLNWSGMKYSSEIKGLKRFISFMKKQGYLADKNYKTSELIFSDREEFNEADNNGK